MMLPPSGDLPEEGRGLRGRPIEETISQGGVGQPWHLRDLPETHRVGVRRREESKSPSAR